MVDTRKIGAAPTALLRTLHGAGALGRDGLMAGLGLNRRQFTDAFRRLEIRGYAVIDDNGTVSLTLAGQDAAGRKEEITGTQRGKVKIVRDTLRERAWRAMRVRRAFTIGEIVADAEHSGDEGRPHDNIGRYLSRLCQAGYLKELPRRMPGTAVGSNGFKRYLLTRNTGPRAPVYREGSCAVHDPNTGEEHLCLPR